MRRHFVQGSLLAIALMAGPVLAQEEGGDEGTSANTEGAAAPEAAETAPSSLDPQPGDSTPSASPGSDSSWMKDWHVGPALSVSIPHPINYGIEVGFKKYASFGFQTGSYEADVGDVKAEISNWDLRARWHPFQGTFFAGVAYGTQTLGVEAKKKIDVAGGKTETTMAIDVDTVYTTPHIGWIGATESGFLFGFELGYQMANSSKAKNLKITTDAAAPNPAGTKEFTDLQKNVEDAAEMIGKKSLPHLGFKFGWMF